MNLRESLRGLNLKRFRLSTFTFDTGKLPRDVVRSMSVHQIVDRHHRSNDSIPIESIVSVGEADSDHAVNR